MFNTKPKYLVVCPHDQDSWIEVPGQFDRDGELCISVMEIIPNHPNDAFKEQCIYLTRQQILDLRKHLKDCLYRPNFGDV